MITRKQIKEMVETRLREKLGEPRIKSPKKRSPPTTGARERMMLPSEASLDDGVILKKAAGILRKKGKREMADTCSTLGTQIMRSNHGDDEVSDQAKDLEGADVLRRAADILARMGRTLTSRAVGATANLATTQGDKQ